MVSKLTQSVDFILHNELLFLHPLQTASGTIIEPQQTDQNPISCENNEMGGFDYPAC